MVSGDVRLRCIHLKECSPHTRSCANLVYMDNDSLNCSDTCACSLLPSHSLPPPLFVQGGMRTLGMAVVAVAALALAVVTTFSATEDTRIVTEAKPSMELAVVGGDQQTTELKAVWKPLRNQDPGFYPDRIWLYAGRETYLWGRGKEVGDLKAILRKGHYETTVMTFNSLKVAPLRAVAWDQSTHVMIFPPFTEYPDLHDIAKKDLRNYVSTGNNIVFLGGFASIGLMNEIFGFRLKAETYQSGPFYQNERYARGTIFEYLPTRLGEDGLIYGCSLQSLPPGGKSFYDSLGDSVAWSVRYDFGMITYVANNYMSVSAHPPSHAPAALSSSSRFPSHAFPCTRTHTPPPPFLSSVCVENTHFQTFLSTFALLVLVGRLLSVYVCVSVPVCVCSMRE